MAPPPIHLHISTLHKRKQTYPLVEIPTREVDLSICYSAICRQSTRFTIFCRSSDRIVSRCQPPHPRLFRCPEIKSLVNRMGFNNDGAHAVAGRISRAKKAGLKIAVGGNIGKNLATSVEDAPRDYTAAALALRDVVDYLVINVSSPNTPGLRSLQDENSLEGIVQPIRSAAPKLPLFIKVAPDHFREFIDGVESIVKSYNLSGVICGNTLAYHDLEKGGLSGAAIYDKNLQLCRAYSNTRAFPFLIGVGGIGNTQSAKAYLQSGTQLVQIYSSLVFEGPRVIEDIIKRIS